MKITPVAFRNAPDHLVSEKTSSLRAMFPDLAFELVEKEPDMIWFHSGGSEREAISHLSADRFTLLLAGFEDNAFAAAMEVKAWAGREGVPVMLVSFDEAVQKGFLQRYEKVCRSLRMLAGQRAGLIGGVSHWLVASGFPLALASQRFGVDIIHFSWDKLPGYRGYAADPDFLEVFRGSGIKELEAESGVYGFLMGVIVTHQLEAITLECFDMVNDNSVTACLALALLNSRGIVAGCEGDLVSMLGMMLIRSLTGYIPWMANVAGYTDGRVILAHCTAPLNLVGDFRLDTHFETDKSAAIQGHISMEEVTLFRLGMDLDKAFIASGRIAGRPNHPFACRTQTEVQLAEADLKKLLQNPLGNHHLVIPGDHADLIRLACAYKGIEVV